jgi:chromosome segregation ATPase
MQMANQKNGSKGKGAASNSAAMKELEAAKKRFAEANKKMQEQRGLVTKAKRLIATGDKKIATLEKKIGETKDAPSKAAEILIKKAEDMERKAAEMAAEQDKVLKEASTIEGRINKKTEELESAKKKADAELEAMGVSTKVTRASSGTSVERRAKNNFQYRLKTKGWDLNYNVKGRIESATKYGLTVVFEESQISVTGGSIKETWTHPYGEGSLVALGSIVKEHGQGVEAAA